MKPIYLLLPLLLLAGFLNSQAEPASPSIKIIEIQPGEKWWGGVVNAGTEMPFKPGYSCDLYGDLQGNQGQPLLVSNQGRVIWSEDPFSFAVSDHELTINATAEVQVMKGGEDLKSAFVFASKNYFPPPPTEKCPTVCSLNNPSTTPG